MDVLAHAAQYAHHMAHLWTLDGPNDWTAQQLSGDSAVADGVAVVNSGDERVAWMLLSASLDLRVNGLPVPLGVAMLEDRDEIRLPGFAAWFSTESLARVEPFPESIARGVCPRCKQTISHSAPAVCCPSCGLWHHESDEFPCWTYASTCAGCAQATALDAGYRWTPEDL